LHDALPISGSSAGHANGTLFGLAPSGVYLATDCCQPCGALLPHLFTLTGTCVLRRLFSVALSVGSHPPGVTWRSALWSPDFPPRCTEKPRSEAFQLTTERLPSRLRGRTLPAGSNVRKRGEYRSPDFFVNQVTKSSTLIPSMRQMDALTGIFRALSY